MNKKIKKLAKKAGFIFWGKNDQGYHAHDIDWSSDYTNEFERFTKLLIIEITKKNQPQLEEIKFHFR